ncbi:hypothetical protein ACJX0J_042498 [Zea mays]
MWGLVEEAKILSLMPGQVPEGSSTHLNHFHQIPLLNDFMEASSLAYPDRDTTSGEIANYAMLRDKDKYHAPTIVQNIFFLKASTGYKIALIFCDYSALFEWNVSESLVSLVSTGNTSFRDAYSNHEHEVQNRQQ